MDNIIKCCLPPTCCDGVAPLLISVSCIDGLLKALLMNISSGARGLFRTLRSLAIQQVVDYILSTNY